MAPALTEPLSPKEKLSSSAATASPTTRSSKKLDTTATIAATSTSNSQTSATLLITNSTTSKQSITTSESSTLNNNKESKKNSNRIVTPTKRVTRSKDNTAHYQRDSTTPVTGIDKTSTLIANNTTAINRRNNNNCNKDTNEQMGLSAARNSNNSSNTLNNNNNKNELNITTAKDKEPNINLTPSALQTPLNNCKDNSTEQLLADLTNDCEEAITAEICLRNKLPEVNLSKDLNKSEELTDHKTITVETASLAQHMESELLIEAEKAEADATVKLESKLPAAPNNVYEKTATLGDVSTFTQQQQQTTCTRFPLRTDGELPPIGTDSTMTASEIEDNLEERLSQLDGSALPAVIAAANDVDAYAALVAQPADTSVVSPLVATTSAQQQHVAEMELASHQTIQVPEIMSPIVNQVTTSQQQQAVNYTPQSTTSTLSGVSLPQNFLKDGGAEDLGDQDLEEMLKAFKSLDGVPNTTDTLCDLNVLFNEVFPQVNNYEDINSQSTSTTPQNKPNPIKESHLAIEARQIQLNDKIDMLMQRMRKLQARHMCKHTSTEIAGLFEWSARVSAKVSHPLRSAKMSEQDAALMAVVAGRPPTQHWQEQKQSILPMAQMSATLRHLDTAASEQQMCAATTNSSHNNSGYGLGLQQTKRTRKQQASTQESMATAAAGSINTQSETKADEVIPPYDTYVASELTHVAGMLHSEMREVQNAIDSDATESSSGGESADEMVSYNNQSQQSLSISKRAVWRYSRDRAAIALRWSWVLAQINDLELKIRQHGDLHSEMNRSKGEIVLESPPGATKSADNNATTTTNSVNGYRSNSFSESNDETHGCCRTRALVLSEFRKRKLFQTTNMHTISKKAARPCNIKCGCQWPLQPCALCTGRPDPTAPRELPDTLMPAQRVALLDSGYHPVLSFPEDIPQSIHFESIVRQPDWQYRVYRNQSKAIVKSVWKAEREAAAAAAGTRRHGETKRRYIRRKERNNVSQSTTTTATALSNIDDKAAAITSMKLGETSNGDGTMANNNNNTISNGTASTPTSSTCTTTPTTPLVANSNIKKRQRRNNNNNNHPQILDYQQLQSSNNQTTKLAQSVVQQLTMISSNNNNRSSNNNHNKTSTISSASYNNKNNNNNHKLNHQYNNNHNGQLSAANNNINGGHSDNSNNEQHWHNRSRNVSPTHGSGSSQNQGRHERNVRRRRISYDIDNIVIPLSYAAAARVEILPYKEIPIPKWTVLNDEQNGDKTNNVDAEITPSAGNSSIEKIKTNESAPLKKKSKKKKNKKHLKKNAVPLTNGECKKKPHLKKENIKHKVETLKVNGNENIKDNISVESVENANFELVKNTPTTKVATEMKTEKVAATSKDIKKVNSEINNSQTIKTTPQKRPNGKLTPSIATVTKVEESTIVAASVKTEEATIVAAGAAIKTEKVTVAATKMGGTRTEGATDDTKPAASTRATIVKSEETTKLAAATKITAAKTEEATIEAKTTATKTEETIIAVPTKIAGSKIEEATIETKTTAAKTEATRKTATKTISVTTVAAATVAGGIAKEDKHTNGLQLENKLSAKLTQNAEDGVKKLNNNNLLVNNNTTRSQKRKQLQKKQLQLLQELEPDKKKLKLDVNNSAVTLTSVDDDVQLLDGVNKTELSINGDYMEVTPEEEDEDTSDEAMMARHQRALLEEQRTFATFLKFPWSTRSRANRRVDSRAESSGANTPDPMSPAPHTTSLNVGDNDISIPSPLANNNPLDPFNDEYCVRKNQRRQERRRTTSSKLRDNCRRSFTPERHEYVRPYSPFEFPLSDEVYNKILEDMKKPPAPYPIFNSADSLASMSNGTGGSGGGAGVCGNGGKYRHNGSTTKRGNHKSFSHCDASGNNNRRRKRSKNNSNSNRGKGKCDGGVKHINGGDSTVDDDDDEDEFDDYSLTDEVPPVDLDDDDDDYPKHHLAPLDDDNTFFDSSQQNTKHNGTNGNGLNGDSETDDADEDPFIDDDPNDPEWKRGLGERAEQRMRKKF